MSGEENTEPAEEEPLVFDLDDPNVAQAPGSAIIRLPRRMQKGAANEPDPNHLTGTTIADRYAIMREIGRGGMGVVYLATQDTLDREVVVKVLSREMIKDEEARKRFEREARGMSQLQHPNLVTIYDYGAYQGLSYIVMEHVDGEPLDKVLLRRDRFYWNDFLRVAIQILDGVGEAHSKGIVHRDLKPANIMLCERHGQGNFVKVLDFGLARFRSTKEVTKELFGSVSYLSPEIVKGETVDMRSDVYALGVIFYEMLTGRKPFEGDDYSVMYKHVNDEPPALEEFLPFDHLVPEGASRLIHRCIAKNSELRPKDAHELLQLLTAEVSRWTGLMPFDAMESGAPPRYREIAAQTGSFRAVTMDQNATAENRRDDAGIPAERQKSTPVIPFVALVAAVLIAALVFWSQKPEVPTPVAAVDAAPDDLAALGASIGSAESLVKQRKFGRATELLDTLGDGIAKNPRYAARVASLRDEIAIEQLVMAAETARDDAKVDEARSLYRKVLMRDPSHEAALAGLAELQPTPALEEPALSTPRVERTAQSQVAEEKPVAAEKLPTVEKEPVAPEKPAVAEKKPAANRKAAIEKQSFEETQPVVEKKLVEKEPDSTPTKAQTSVKSGRVRAPLLTISVDGSLVPAVNAPEGPLESAGREFVPEEPVLNSKPDTGAKDEEDDDEASESATTPKKPAIDGESVRPVVEDSSASSVGPGHSE